MQWVSAHFQPTTLFSLKPSWATSSGGKSLLLPTPYALKMALLDVAIRVDGLASAENDWSWLRKLKIYIQLPQQIVVTNLFAKILKLRRSPAAEGSVDAGPFQKTIGYREYVYHPEPMRLALGTEDGNVEALSRWLLNLSYMGKRGGFVQLVALPTLTNNLDQYICLTEDVMETGEFPASGLVQIVDDCDLKSTFDRVNIYTKSRPKRIKHQIVLPYHLVKSSRSYSLYERI